VKLLFTVGKGLEKRGYAFHAPLGKEGKTGEHGEKVAKSEEN